MRTRKRVTGRSFHESFSSGKLKPPTPRGTGLVFAAVALIVALLWRRELIVALPALGLAFVLALVSFTAPRLLEPLNVIWFRFGLLLQRIVNPVVMFALFAFVFVPAGLIMRLFYDPLRLRRGPKNATYWIAHDKGEDAKMSMRNQF